MWPTSHIRPNILLFQKNRGDQSGGDEQRLVPGNRSDFLDVVIEKIQCDEILWDAWRGAFEDLGADKEVWSSKKSYFLSANITCHFLTYFGNLFSNGGQNY